MKKLSIVAFVFALAGVFASNVISKPLLQNAYGRNNISSCVLGTIVGTNCGSTGTTQCLVRVANPDMTTSDVSAWQLSGCTTAFKRN